jgi:glutathione S-transferase
MSRHMTEISPCTVNDGDAIPATADVADLPARVGALLPIKLYVFPPSSRALAVIALGDHLKIGCEIHPIDLSKGDQRTTEYAAMNPNMKMPMLEDNGLVLWESNAILFYLATRKPQSGLWPSDTRHQADVLRWLAWQSAHWDAESLGMIVYEKTSKMVLGLGPSDPPFVARGEQNFMRFASVLNELLKGHEWLTGEAVTIADFSVAGLVLSAERMQLPVHGYPETRGWYGRVASSPAWRAALAAKDAAMAAWQAARDRGG